MNTTAFDVASYFIKQPESYFPSSYDGNMKLQKLIVFANLLHYAEYNEFLYQNDMNAFKNGIVVEDIRKPFKLNYDDFTQNLSNQKNNFAPEQLMTLEISLQLFNKLSAKELSDLHHELDTWKVKYDKSNLGNYYLTEVSKIHKEDIYERDILKLKTILESYRENKKTEGDVKEEIINGITFYYDLYEMEHYIKEKDLLTYLEGLSLELLSDGGDDTFSLAYDEHQGVYYY